MKRATLSLHHLTAMDVDAFELVSLAASEGCKNVCLFTYMPPAFQGKYPLVRGQDVKVLLAQMRRHSTGCLSLEVFPLTKDSDWSAMEDSLAIGAELNASFATVHSHLTDVGHAQDALGRLSDIAAKYRIKLGVEFNPFSNITTLKQAAELIEPLDSANIGLVLDTLHAARSGVEPAEISAFRNCISFVQISDGPARVDHSERWIEAISSRMVPGSGDLPLGEMLRSIQSDLHVSIEVPQTGSSQPTTDPKERTSRAVRGTRMTLETAGFTVAPFDHSR